MTKIKCEFCDTQKNDWCKGKCEFYNDGYVQIVKKKGHVEAPPDKREQRGGIMPKRVYCVDTKTWYDSAKQAAELNDLSVVAVQNACNGRSITCKGMQWIYEGMPVPPKIMREPTKSYAKNKPAVRDLFTGVVYQTISDAAEACGIAKQTVYLYIAPGTKRQRRFEWVTP